MPLIGRIRDEAISTLTEAKMIKSERGPIELRKLVEKLLKKANKADKTELARMSTYDVFVTFLYIFIIFWILAIIHGFLIRNEFLTRKSVLRVMSSDDKMFNELLDEYSQIR